MSFLKRSTALIPFVGAPARTPAPIEAFGPSSDSPIHQAFSALVASLDKDEQVHLAVRMVDNGVQLSAKRESIPTRNPQPRQPTTTQQRSGDAWLPGLHPPGFPFGDQSIAGEFVERTMLPNGLGGFQQGMVYRNPLDGRFHAYQMVNNPVRLEYIGEVNAKPEWLDRYHDQPPLFSQVVR